jgi:hypothetical protein
MVVKWSSRCRLVAPSDYPTTPSSPTACSSLTFCVERHPDMRPVRSGARSGRNGRTSCDRKARTSGVGHWLQGQAESSSRARGASSQVLRLAATDDNLATARRPPDDAPVRFVRPLGSSQRHRGTEKIGSGSFGSDRPPLALLRLRPLVTGRSAASASAPSAAPHSSCPRKEPREAGPS